MSDDGAGDEALARPGLDLVPLAGGYSGEMFVAGEGSDRVVVRVYARRPGRAAVDAALLELLRGLVPVPRVLEARAPTQTEPGVLVTEFVDGVLLERLLADPPPGLDPARVGAALGDVLDTLSGVPFPRAGSFSGPDLAPHPVGLPGDLTDWAEHGRATGRLASWPDPDYEALLRLVDRAESLVEAETSPRANRTLLVHSDFNAKNILVDPATGEVKALLDWEFAHAGSPFTDLGNLTRFEREPPLVEAALAAMRRVGVDDHERLLRLGRALDLWALIELASRPAGRPVPDLAAELLLAQARSGDLLAWPWPGVHRARLPQEVAPTYP